MRVNTWMLLLAEGIQHMLWHSTLGPPSLSQTVIVCPAQTKDSKTHEIRDARGPTSAEFENEVLLEAVAAAKKAGIKNPIMAFDNDRIHVRSQRKGREGWIVLKVPTYSFDFMKVIEHFHGYVAAEFERLVEEDVQKNGDVKHRPEFYQGLLAKAIANMGKAESIAADVSSLRETLRAVKRVGGDYAEKPTR
jgi:hypothetical protein